MESTERRSVLDGERSAAERKALSMRWLRCMGGVLLAVTLIGAAVALGLLLPPHADSPPHAAQNGSASSSGGDPPPYAHISAVVGWLYFIAWSVSFWPQVFLNCRRRSVEGLSLDFELYNMLGFTCYSAYNAAMLWSPSIIAAFKAQHGGSAPTVRINDFVFSAHAMVVTALTLVQCVIYPYKRGRISFLGYILILGALAALALYALLVWLVRLEAFNWLNFITFVSYVKIGVTVIKYVPQVVLNCRRGSTQGWSVWNVWLDFSGGALSLAQQVMDSATTGQWGGFAGDIAKTCLGALSIVFDAVFLTQHYICLNRRRGISSGGGGGSSSGGGGGGGAQYFDDLNLSRLRYAELSDPTSTPGGGLARIGPGDGALSTSRDAPYSAQYMYSNRAPSDDYSSRAASDDVGAWGFGAPRRQSEANAEFLETLRGWGREAREAEQVSGGRGADEYVPPKKHFLALRCCSTSSSRR